MKTTLKLIACLIPAIALTGCAEMLQASQEARATLDKIMGHGGKTERHTRGESAPVTNDTPSKICATYRENSVNALRYHDKKISIKGKITDIYQAGYAGVTLKVGEVNIEYITNDFSQISKLKKGKIHKAIGIIYDIQREYDLSAKCKIIIRSIN